MKTYERFCQPRFKKLEDDLSKVDEKVDSINAIVTNGLKEKVEAVRKQSNWLLGVLLSLMIAIIGSTVLLLITNNNRYYDLQQKIEQVYRDTQSIQEERTREVQ